MRRVQTGRVCRLSLRLRGLRPLRYAQRLDLRILRAALEARESWGDLALPPAGYVHSCGVDEGWGVGVPRNARAWAAPLGAVWEAKGTKVGRRDVPLLPVIGEPGAYPVPTRCRGAMRATWRRGVCAVRERGRREVERKGQLGESA